MIRIDLLTANEYKKYESKIPYINCWWWLRSPGLDSNRAMSVYGDNSVGNRGNCVHGGFYGVRPALYVDQDILKDMIGHQIIYATFPWFVIDSNLAIAEVPIGFTYFDEKSNDYETSHIKQYIEQWVEEREYKYES